MLKVLYIGGIFATEYGLYREAENNPEIDLICACECANHMGSLGNVKLHRIGNRNDIDALKASFKPDLVLYRGWCSEARFRQEGEILWSQEIMATNSNGKRFEGFASTYDAKDIAYNIKDLATQNGQFWLPRCITKYWSKVPCQKDIPFMVATNMPSDGIGGKLKRKSLDILVKPIVEWDKNLIYAFEGAAGGLGFVDYMNGTVKPSFLYIDMHKWMSRAKIYASPTTIWYDKGCISQKTIHAMACGALTLTNRYMDIEDILGKDGENLIYSNSPEETLDKVKYYLVHESEREALAARGYDYIHKVYNWPAHLTRLHKEWEACQR